MYNVEENAKKFVAVTTNFLVLYRFRILARVVVAAMNKSIGRCMTNWNASQMSGSDLNSGFPVAHMYWRRIDLRRLLAAASVIVGKFVRATVAVAMHGLLKHSNLPMTCSV